MAQALGPVYAGPEVEPAGLGIQIHLHRENVPELINHLTTLGLGWVKVQVSWKLYEPTPDGSDPVRWADLDQLVDVATANDIQLLLSVAKAPEWSRPTTEFDGPPTDYARFGLFMTRLASRYNGRIAAYELWNEPNLQREWNGVPLDPAQLVALIAVGADAVRAVDPNAQIISAAPAPTGIDDGVIASDDRRYVSGMLAAGVANHVDGFGIHPYGWGNPATATVAQPAPNVPSHADHRSFFFLDTWREYRQLLDEAGLSSLPLWATEFGWGTYADFGEAPPAGAEFMQYVSLEQQAQYTLDAISLAQDLGPIGPLFVWNLNFAPTFGPALTESGYSILNAAAEPRPVYFALQSIRTRPCITQEPPN